MFPWWQCIFWWRLWALFLWPYLYFWIYILSNQTPETRNLHRQLSLSLDYKLRLRACQTYELNCDSTLKTCTSSRQIKPQHRGWGVSTKSSPNEKQFDWRLLRERNQVPSMEWHWVQHPHCSAGPTLMSCCSTCMPWFLVAFPFCF